jgi:Glycosyltransferase family 87
MARRLSGPAEMRVTAAGVRVIRRVGLGLAVVGALFGAYVFWFHVTTDPLGDFHVYYDAAARLNAGQPLYPPGARIYPPLFSILFRPLAILPIGIAAAIWEGILLASLGLTLWRIGIRRRAAWLAAGLLGMGIGWTLAIGQAEAIVTLLLTLGSPLTVALAGNIKLFPLLAGIYWLARRDWRSFGRFVAWTAGLVLLQLVLDPADTFAFPGTLNVVGPQIVGAGSLNLSPFASSPLLWAALLVTGVAVTLRLGRTRWGWGAAVALAVLASPHLFEYMLMSLLACLREPDQPQSGALVALPDSVVPE